MTERDVDLTTGEALRKAREAIRPKLSQDALAKRLGVRGGRRTIMRWEKDEHLPGPPHRVKLIRELNLPGDFFEHAAQAEERLSRRVASLEETTRGIEQSLETIKRQLPEASAAPGQ